MNCLIINCGKYHGERNMGQSGVKRRTLTGQVEGQEFAKDPEQEQRKRTPDVCMLQKARRRGGQKCQRLLRSQVR